MVFLQISASDAIASIYFMFKAIKGSSARIRTRSCFVCVCAVSSQIVSHDVRLSEVISLFYCFALLSDLFLGCLQVASQALNKNSASGILES